jgi:uncharacterized protein
MDIELIYFVLVMFASFFIYSFVGFGAALVGVPLLLIFMQAKLIIPAFIAIVLINGIFLVREGKNHIQWQHVRRLLLGGILGVPVGVLGLKYLPSQAIVVGVNVCTLIFACLYLSGIKFRLREHASIECTVGLVSGILGGGSGIGGPPIVMYGIAREWQKDVFRSTMLVYFVGIGLWTNTSLVLLKMHSMETVRMILMALIPSLLASWMGALAKRKANEKVFRRIVLVVIITTSLIGLGRYLL